MQSNGFAEPTEFIEAEEDYPQLAEDQYYATAMKTDNDAAASETEIFIENSTAQFEGKCFGDVILNEASGKQLPSDSEVQLKIGPNPDKQQVLYIGDADLSSSGEERSDLDDDVERESHYEDDNFEADDDVSSEGSCRLTNSRNRSVRDNLEQMSHFDDESP